MLCSRSLLHLIRERSSRRLSLRKKNHHNKVELKAKEEQEEDFHILELDDRDRDGALQLELEPGSDSLDGISISSTTSWDSNASSSSSRLGLGLGLDMGRTRAESFDITLTEQSRLLDIDHIQQICRELPRVATLCTWSLAYSTHKHGSSLATLYRSMAKMDCYTLVVVRDNHGQVFGSFNMSPLQLSPSFYGTGHSFLFTFTPCLQVYRWTLTNSYFIKGCKEFLAFGGGGGRFGLWLCGGLLRGRSQRCETFDNDVLSAAEDFFIDELEVWALV